MVGDVLLNATLGTRNRYQAASLRAREKHAEPGTHQHVSYQRFLHCPCRERHVDAPVSLGARVWVPPKSVLGLR